MAIAVALAALYGPTLFDLATGPWQTEAHRHGPWVALVAAWLFWRHRGPILGASGAPRDAAGTALLASGLALYAVGRSQEIALAEAGSAVPVVAGILLLVRDAAALRAAAFPLLFLAFAVPLPGILVDAMTSPLKAGVSAAVEEVLFRAGLPVARSGVLLTLGQYQLLMDDACSGLHSMVSLAALGLLFLHLVDRRDVLHNAVMVAAIVPIAFAANVARVLALSLVTYHLGDAAGQGFLHDLAGFLLFAVALGGFFSLDAALHRVRPTA